jgi:hypothetical protein
MPLHLALSASIEIFRNAQWDGIVGLGFTMDHELENYGMSVVDHLLELKSCENKFFVFSYQGDNGVIDFCQFPKEVEKKEEIFWAPIFPDGVENPWGVKIVDIKIQFEQ